MRGRHFHGGRLYLFVCYSDLWMLMIMGDGVCSMLCFCVLYVVNWNIYWLLERERGGLISSEGWAETEREREREKSS